MRGGDSGKIRRSPGRAGGWAAGEQIRKACIRPTLGRCFDTFFASAAGAALPGEGIDVYMSAEDARGLSDDLREMADEVERMLDELE